MNLPGFTAEGSLYKTAQLYRGHYSGMSWADARASVVPQDCNLTCALKWEACNVGCTIGTGGWGALFCVAGCGYAFYDCLDQCPSDSGGGGTFPGGGGGRPTAPGHGRKLP